MAGEYPSGYFEGAHPARMRALYSDDDGCNFHRRTDCRRGKCITLRQGRPYARRVCCRRGLASRTSSMTGLRPDEPQMEAWATPLAHLGGLSCALHAARLPKSTMPLLPQPQYRRVYGGTLLRRSDSDWIVLAAISTAHNGGGTWGLCCLSAPSADGPWSEPALLLTPQSSGWHAHPTEFYPAFTDSNT